MLPTDAAPQILRQVRQVAAFDAARQFLPVLCLWLAAPPPQPAFCQTETTQRELHFTLRGWADDTWLLLEDRDAVGDGRLSRVGILQRFHAKIDAEYGLDLISNRFSLAEEYDFHQRDNGFRWAGGSINRREMVDDANLRLKVNTGEHWHIAVNLDKKDDPVIHRSFLRVSVNRTWQSGAYGFVEGSLTEIKPNSDLAFGGGLSTRSVRFRTALYILDAFNGITTQLIQHSRFVQPTTITHIKQPFALRSSIELFGGNRFRAEAHGAFLLPTEIHAYATGVPDSGFTQGETFGLAGLLIETVATRGLTIGAFGTYVRASLDRRPTSRGLAEDSFLLTERTLRAGGVVLTRPFARLTAETWVAWNSRTERRIHVADSMPNVDWEDRAWSGQLSLRYGATKAFVPGLAIEWDLRDVLRGHADSAQLSPDKEGRFVGIGQVPSWEFLGRYQTRVRFETGFHFARGRQVTLGFRIDLDADNYAGANSRFYGAHGRFEFSW